MILVVDSGSTKADWVLLEGNSIAGRFNTHGINPMFHDGDFIEKVLKENDGLTSAANAVRKVYFFGAGCSSDERCEIVHTALTSYFKNAAVSVDHDIMGAVLATCGDHPGISCIIGTGSNACFYDGTKIHENNFGMGFILADEAAGSWLGKKLLTHYLYALLPADLRIKFESLYTIDKDEVIRRVYQSSGANVWLASFASFFADNKEHEWVIKMTEQGFSEFLDLYVMPMEGKENLNIHFVGSIASIFSKNLKEILKKKKLKAGKIIQKPIEELASYYLLKENADDY